MSPRSLEPTQFAFHATFFSFSVRTTLATWAQTNIDKPISSCHHLLCIAYFAFFVCFDNIRLQFSQCNGSGTSAGRLVCARIQSQTSITKVTVTNHWSLVRDSSIGQHLYLIDLLATWVFSLPNSVVRTCIVRYSLPRVRGRFDVNAKNWKKPHGEPSSGGRVTCWSKSYSIPEASVSIWSAWPWASKRQLPLEIGSWHRPSHGK